MEHKESVKCDICNEMNHPSQLFSGIWLNQVVCRHCLEEQSEEDSVERNNRDKYQEE